MANQPLTAVKLVRLAEFVSPDEWIRPLNEWSPPPMPEPELDGDGKGKAWLMAEQEREHAEVQFESLVRSSAGALCPRQDRNNNAQKKQSRRVAGSGAAEMPMLYNLSRMCRRSVTCCSSTMMRPMRSSTPLRPSTGLSQRSTGLARSPRS